MTNSTRMCGNATVDGHHHVSRCDLMKKMAEADDKTGVDWNRMIDAMTTDELHLNFEYEKCFLKEALERINIKDDMRNKHHRKNMYSLFRGKCWTCGERSHEYRKDECRTERGETCEICGDTRHKEVVCLSNLKCVAGVEE